jgi:tetratricopeptide (TPR) repeat protein
MASLSLAQSTLEDAISLTRQKKFQQARQVLRGLAEPSGISQRIIWHRVQAAVASGLGENLTAATEMQAALALRADDAGLLLATAAAELAAGELDQALQHALASGNTASAQALIGDIQERRGEFVNAAKAYQAAIALAPDREEYRIALALELIQHQTFRPAITLLQQAAPLFPHSARIRTLLGIAHYALGDNNPAINALISAIQADPGLEPAYAYLTRILLESSNAPPQSAVDALCRWNEIVCAAVKLRVAREANDASMLAQATKILERAPATNTVARCELARSYEWTERWPEARAQMESCVKLDPSPQNHYRLSVIYNQLGLSELAHQQMKLRERALQQLTEEGARRLNATQGFQYVLK